MLINHGAVRTGKTIVDNDLFIDELRRINAHAKKNGIRLPLYILAGASIGNIVRNILNPLTQKYGFEFKLNKYNQFRLFNVLVCCVGHDDVGQLKPITGMTSYGAYINEGSLANREVFDEICKRCSADENFVARIIVDSNPGGPKHWLKVDYIDKAAADNSKIKAFHWRLDDNPFLSKEYVANLKATTPSGVFYNRKIDGLWATAEGIVYQDISADNYIDDIPKLTSFFVGVDWGYEHKGSLGLFGETAADDKGDVKYVLLKEITAKHKGIDWWQNQAQWVTKTVGFGVPFYCDSARPDNVQKFRDVGCWCPPVDKSIESGVECVAERLKRRTLLIYTAGIEEFDNEINSYVWDEKTGKPVQINDDVMDMTRYAVFNQDKRNRRR
ncbi:MAG: PBSX family phage terminase large subunit [Clostridia bacterium]